MRAVVAFCVFILPIYAVIHSSMAAHPHEGATMTRCDFQRRNCVTRPWKDLRTDSEEAAYFGCKDLANCRLNIIRRGRRLAWYQR